MGRKTSKSALRGVSVKDRKKNGIDLDAILIPPQLLSGICIGINRECECINCLELLCLKKGGKIKWADIKRYNDPIAGGFKFIENELPKWIGAGRRALENAEKEARAIAMVSSVERVIISAMDIIAAFFNFTFSLDRIEALLNCEEDFFKRYSAPILNEPPSKCSRSYDIGLIGKQLYRNFWVMREEGCGDWKNRKAKCYLYIGKNSIEMGKGDMLDWIMNLAFCSNSDADYLPNDIRKARRIMPKIEIEYISFPTLALNDYMGFDMTSTEFQSKLFDKLNFSVPCRCIAMRFHCTDYRTTIRHKKEDFDEPTHEQLATLKDPLDKKEYKGNFICYDVNCKRGCCSRYSHYQSLCGNDLDVKGKTNRWWHDEATHQYIDYKHIYPHFDKSISPELREGRALRTQHYTNFIVRQLFGTFLPSFRIFSVDHDPFMGFQVSWLWTKQFRKMSESAIGITPNEEIISNEGTRNITDLTADYLIGQFGIVSFGENSPLLDFEDKVLRDWVRLVITDTERTKILVNIREVLDGKDWADVVATRITLRDDIDKDDLIKKYLSGRAYPPHIAKRLGDKRYDCEIVLKVKGKKDRMIKWGDWVEGSCVNSLD